MKTSYSTYWFTSADSLLNKKIHVAVYSKTTDEWLLIFSTTWFKFNAAYWKHDTRQIKFNRNRSQAVYSKMLKSNLMLESKTSANGIYIYTACNKSGRLLESKNIRCYTPVTLTVLVNGWVNPQIFTFLVIQVRKKLDAPIMSWPVLLVIHTNEYGKCPIIGIVPYSGVSSLILCIPPYCTSFHMMYYNNHYTLAKCILFGISNCS